MAPSVDSILLVLPVLAGVLTALVLDQTLKRVRLPLDHPNERSLHSVPTPRSGGLVAIPVVLVLWIALVPAVPWSLWLACALLFAVSALDDIHRVPVVARFAFHLVAAALVCATLFDINGRWLTLVVGTLAIGWMINLYNFMDGADGLAGGMALIGFGAYGIAAWIGDYPDFAIAAWTLSGAALGFLVWNFPPAKVFLGDAGSIPFGGLAGALGLLGWTRGIWPAWFPIVVFSPFIVDATVTLARRTLRGERIWQAHREHYYQRLVQLGWGHKRTVLAEYVLMLGCATIAIAGLQMQAAASAGMLFSMLAAYALLMAFIEKAWHGRGGET